MSPQDWNKEVEKYAPPYGAFLQMWEWGEVQASLGSPIKRIYEETPEGVVIAQGIWQALPLGASYWFFPRGPLGSAPQEKQEEMIESACKGSAFIKVEPCNVPKNGTVVAERHPAHTMVVDLSREKEEIYAGMKPKTRYNIRLAEKKGVSVEYAGEEGLDRFMTLMRQTAKRDGFHAHAPERYVAIIKKFQGPTCAAFFAFATAEGRDLAANIMIDAGKTRTYLHGASANEKREVMAPYALHAKLMEDAKEKGMKEYDFWGVAPEDANEAHPWAGITRFKQGFGGVRMHMPGTFDIPINKTAYLMYRIARKIRGLK